MTTENEVIEYVRDIDTLLALDTYQGMSDAEIQSIIDYKVSVAEERATNAAHLDMTAQNGRAMVEAQAQAVQASTYMLQSLLRSSVPYVNITGEEVE